MLNLLFSQWRLSEHQNNDGVWSLWTGIAHRLERTLSRMYNRDVRVDEQVRLGRSPAKLPVGKHNISYTFTYKEDEKPNSLHRETKYHEIINVKGILTLFGTISLANSETVFFIYCICARRFYAFDYVS